MKDVLRTIKRERSWHAWVGTVEVLEKLGIEAQKMAQKRADEILREIELEESDASATEDSGGIFAELEYNSRQLEFLVKFTEGDDEVSGALGQVMPEVDRRSLKTISFRASNSGYGPYGDLLELKFSRNPGIYGPGSFAPSAVVLTVRSSDAGWAREAFAHLSEKVELGVPWWGRLHSIAGSTVMAAIAFATTILVGYTIAVYGVGIPEHGSTLAGTIAWVIILVVAIALALTFIAPSARNKLFPPFELTGESQSTGTRFMIFLGVTLVSVVFSIFTNVLTR
jgi:hypothetical protein